MIPLASWEPDRSRFDTNVSDSMINAIPRLGGYGPVPQLVTLSDALPAAPKGAFYARASDGTGHIFAGTKTHLYKFDSSSNDWTDKSDGVTFGVPTDDHWQFEQFGNWVIAANTSDGEYYFDLGTPAGDFAALGGSPPKARVLGVIGDFLFLGELPSQARGIRWSGINAPDQWTVQKRLAGDQIFPDGDEITGIVGFERGGLIFQRNAIREAVPALDTPLVFRFQKVEENRGALAPGSIVSVGRAAFYLSDDGFYAFGAANTHIGTERVNRFFLNDMDAEFRLRVQGAADPINQTVWWRYNSTSSPSLEDYSDRVIGYHYTLDKWFRVDVNLSWIFTVASPGYNLDNLDTLGYTLDTLPGSLDSRSWTDTAPLLGGFTDDFKLAFFSGEPMEATLQTGDVDLVQAAGNPNLEGRRSFVRGFRLVSDAAGPFGRIGSASRYGGDRTWTNETAASTVTGLIPQRTSGRLHRFEVRIPAGDTWGHALGVMHDAEPEGVR